MPPTMSFTVGVDEFPELPLEFDLLLEQAAADPSARAPIAATVIARLSMRGLPFKGGQGWGRGDGWPAQLPADSEWLGGRQDRTRFSSRVSRNSAISVITAMIAIPAKTVFWSRRPCA